ncbi:hypothetical protein [Phenylobacterium sp.]|uniref:hypothetical protein n=1 Tax=Phenylobacterium sp. TaxID=1871053 RepID=UPI00374D30C4
MSESWIDPGNLEDDALKQWYLSSPADVERERQEAAARRYQDFFYGGRGNGPDPQFGCGVPTSSQDIDPGITMPAPTGNIDPGFAMPAPSRDIDPGFTWVAAGPNRFRSVRSQTTPVRAPASSPGYPPPPAHVPRPAQTIAYGALRAPAPSDQELAELRRQQAAFSDTTRKIDLQNSWFAVPALAPAVVALGLGAAGEWATGEVAPTAGRAVANFVERDPYLRVGDNWATRAGRRGHAAFKERVAQKPGWEYEPKLAREGQRPLKPDLGTPKRNPQFPDKRKYIELKPDSPSGRAAGARALKRYQEVTEDPVRLLFYSLKDFI